MLRKCTINICGGVYYISVMYNLTLEYCACYSTYHSAHQGINYAKRKEN